jgi:hypothetical protein
LKRIATLLVLLIALPIAADVIKRGAAVSDARPTPLADVLAKPEAFAGKTIVVEGVVTSACTEKGCWMQLAPEKSKETMHVTFKGYAFFVPTDSKGMKAKIEGTPSVETYSKEKADHLEDEGADFHRNADGTAKQIKFVATGVELAK